MYIRRVWHPPQTNCAISVPGAGTAVTVLQTAQQTDVAPAGYMRRFRHPVQTSWLWAPLGGVNGTGGVGYGARGTGIAVPVPYPMTLLGKASQIPAAFRRQKPAALPCMKP